MADSSPPPDSLLARRSETPTLPPLTLPLPIPSLKTTAAPRAPSAPSLNANPPPGSAPLTPPTETAPPARLGRSGTVTAGLKRDGQAVLGSKKRSGSKQPNPARRSSEAGYEGGVERHGQANDFVDHPSSDDDSDSGKPIAIVPSAPGRSPELSAAAISAALKAQDSDQDDDDDNETTRWRRETTKKNKNPSRGSHAHGRLPLHSRSSSISSGVGGGWAEASGMKPKMRRSASISSTRSVEAGLHPFPHPGLKNRRIHSHSQLKGLERDEEERLAWEKEYQWKSTEEKRLDEDEKKEMHWKRWGPYLSERQWATVREDYSANGDAWTHFPHEHARSRAYRWGEDGLGGITDNHGRVCFSVAMWNGVDGILKERLFGVTGHQGNHGEDVKEMYYYLDSTPTHSYMKFLYKYPQREYPYEQLVRESSNRSREVGEFEITDTDCFEDNKYWDVFVEYAKDEDDADAISIRITAYNRGPEPATLHLVPQLWFRNIWSWPKHRPTGAKMPSLRQVGEGVVEVNEEHLGRYYLHANSSPAPVGPSEQVFANDDEDDEVLVTEDIVTPTLMFTENDTNFERLYGGKNVTPYVKDAFHDEIIHAHRPPLPVPEKVVEKAAAAFSGSSVTSESSEEDEEEYDSDATANGAPPQSTRPDTPPPDTRSFVNPEKKGTKAGAHYVFNNVPGNGGCAVVRLKLTKKTAEEDAAVNDEENFDMVVEERRMDADEFYSRFNSGALSDDLRNIMRQGLSGMLWTKQFYMFIQKEWLEGDPGQPPPPAERKWIRNMDWKHMHIEDVLSMPDKWEYPFFAIWDSAFHCIPLAMIDPSYAKKQLDIMTREWYMKPDGALPAYEWNFSDVNPPVHAWATFRVFKIERKMHGKEDLHFLERVFQKLLINFTWWVNKKDVDGKNVFEGGFLGLDNISPFNRSERLPTGGTMRQADGTGWMAFYCLSMLNIALELAKHNSVYEDIASKFFEHFLFISDAMTFKDGDTSGSEVSLWNDEEGFYFDAITWGPGANKQLPIRSLVGLIPLYATLTLEPATIRKFPGFKKRMDWFIANRGSISKRNIANMSLGGKGDRRLLALASEERLRRILQRMLDEEEFLSDYGIRSLSRYHKEHPWGMDVNGEEFSVHYWPGDSHSGMFGGNSNWRGPIWLATTFLLIESLQRFYQYHGNKFKIECPTGSGDEMNLANVADEIQHRIIHIFARDNEGNRACNGGSELLNKDPHFRDYVPFHEFFHADSGKGLGASHQTGWTGLISYIIWQTGSSARLPRTPRTPRSAASFYFDEIPATPGASEVEYSDASAWAAELSASELSPEDL